MTTLILLGLLAYVWAAAVYIMADLDDGYRYWDRFEWSVHAAFPLVLPVVLVVQTYNEYVAPRVAPKIAKVKAEAKRLYNWVTGRD